MKKIICALLSLILLCSCSFRESVQVVNKGLNFKAHIYYSGREYVCSGEITEDMNATFTMSEGILSGFTTVYSGETVNVSYEGKECEQEYSVFARSLFTPITEMFRFFESNKYSVEENHNIYTSGGKTAAGQFTLCVSPAGLPISAKLSSPDFLVEFYDVSVAKQNK